MKTDLDGWCHSWEVRGQCQSCTHVVCAHRMRACDVGQASFPEAERCQHYEGEEDEND